MNAFKNEDYNTFWGQYTDIEQPIANITQKIHPTQKIHILEPIREKPEENSKEKTTKTTKTIFRSCNSMHFWLCVIIFIYLFV